MKKLTLFLISAYQRTIAVLLFNLGLKGNCRFSPTCSEYAKLSISQNGLAKGSYLAMIRLLKCQPFYNGK
ncbi:MAG TPA: membrane protein insertion efficiency factor YidD [Patescibacteria group bacterium]|jgi:putative membrane protein insertion efficiency factor|nr:membrane protein insertion efficiency factor YidD [Patescibacteria group bacterium]